MKKWKILFWILAVLTLIQLIALPFSESIQYEILSVIFSGITLIPIYGYSYQIAIGNKLVAIIIFSLNCLAFLVCILALSLLLSTSFSIFQLVVVLCILVVFWLIIYPQYAYAFKSGNLWSNNNT